MSKLVTIENEKFVVKLLTLGAILNSFYVKSQDVDIVLGFDEADDYIKAGNGCIGHTVGRCANRIGNAKFNLNGKTYELLANNGPNSIHGGLVPFGKVEWTLLSCDKNKAVFEYNSKHMEAGFPGNVKVTTTYELIDDGLKITYSAISDEDTIFNVTNHSYFNLDKNKNNILSHQLKIPATKCNLNDENGMAKDFVVDVKNTPFDFTEFKKISSAVSTDGVPLNDFCEDIMNCTNEGIEKKVDNIDTNYIYENLDLKSICYLRNDKMQLEVKSDLPDVQIYTGAKLNVNGRDGHYSAYAGVAIEAQFCPNAINYNKFLKPIIKANEKVSHMICFKVTDI